MAITAITAQNTRGVIDWRAEPPAMIAAQIEAVLGKVVARGRAGGRRAVVRNDGALPVRAIKTGLLPGAAAVRAVARALAPHAGIPLVVDPVVGSTSGAQFLDAAGREALKRELLPRAMLVTPNWPEAEALTGERLRRYEEVERVAFALAYDCGCAVLLKGGHAPGERCADCLMTPDGRFRWFESRRIKTPNTHGTGCTLSAAIATELAKGAALDVAVEAAREFLQQSLRANRNVKWGGAGPAAP